MEVQHHIDRQQRRHWRGADAAFHMLFIWVLVMEFSVGN